LTPPIPSKLRANKVFRNYHEIENCSVATPLAPGLIWLLQDCSRYSGAFLKYAEHPAYRYPNILAARTGPSSAGSHSLFSRYSLSTRQLPCSWEYPLLEKAHARDSASPPKHAIHTGRHAKTKEIPPRPKRLPACVGDI